MRRGIYVGRMAGVGEYALGRGGTHVKRPGDETGDETGDEDEPSRAQGWSHEGEGGMEMVVMRKQEVFIVEFLLKLILSFDRFRPCVEL